MNIAGRPTKDEPELCKTVVDLMSEGKSILEFARELGVARSTLYNWEEQHHDFADALTRGREVGQAYWEGQLKSMFVTGRGVTVNAALVKLYFANRFGWHDRVEQDTTVRSMFVVSDEPMTEDEWDEKYGRSGSDLQDCAM